MVACWKDHDMVQSLDTSKSEWAYGNNYGDLSSPVFVNISF
jgi:hypothetical protein